MNLNPFGQLPSSCDSRLAMSPFPSLALPREGAMPPSLGCDRAQFSPECCCADNGAAGAIVMLVGLAAALAGAESMGASPNSAMAVILEQMQMAMANSGNAPAGLSGPMSWGGAPRSGNSSWGGEGGNGPIGNTTPAGPLPDNIDLSRLLAAVPAGNREAARANFPVILAECRKENVTNKAQVAYILATACHESGAGKFMKEFASGDAYEGRLGNNAPGDGRRYKGRGYVQITGKRNYQQWSRRLGVDLVGNPSLAQDPKIAAQILVGGMKNGTFTGKKLGDYINGSGSDMLRARKIVNGMDKAGSIAGLAQKLQAAM